MNTKTLRKNTSDAEHFDNGDVVVGHVRVVVVDCPRCQAPVYESQPSCGFCQYPA